MLWTLSLSAAWLRRAAYVCAARVQLQGCVQTLTKISTRADTLHHARWPLHESGTAEVRGNGPTTHCVGVCSLQGSGLLY